MNHLAGENSPYLLQHADNPVDWFPWGAEALEKARQEDKPVFLSIGYSACHWCHVMANESFEDPVVAGFMNERFICIKVDREERPDLDSIYMEAVVAMTGQGGWPMSVFLTAEGHPFFGGTYFPPTRHYNMPPFIEVLQAVDRLWREDRARLLQSSAELLDQLASRHTLQAPGNEPEGNTLNQAAIRLAQAYDWQHGGWGNAPKFPQPMAIEFLLLRSVLGDKLALDVAEHALNAMSLGGMYDVLGGGFARYSTDNDWLVPHFEKMLYDNAQLSRVYLHAYLLTGEAHYREVCEATLDFIIRELMTHPPERPLPAPGIFSSLDADSEGVEGNYYLWTTAEIRAALSNIHFSELNLDAAEFFLAAYGVKSSGNFEGKTVLQRDLDDSALAERFKVDVDQVPILLRKLHAGLLTYRQQRIPPGLDDKVLTAWNALALSAFSEAARYLKRPDYLAIARQNADFLLSELLIDKRLLRSWRQGQARHDAYLEDYAGLILGLLALYQSDPDPYWFNSAQQLANDMIAHYRDPKGGFFDTRDDGDQLFIRPKDLQDNATPSGNSQAALALLQLSHYTGNGEWRDLAEGALSAIQRVAVRYPTGFSNWLCAFSFSLTPIQETAILGDAQDPRMQALVEELWSQFRPYCLAAISSYPPAPNSPALVQDRSLLHNQPTAYVCQNFVCKLPVNSPNLLSGQLHQEAIPD